jgi:hypothetical protein
MQQTSKRIAGKKGLGQVQTLANLIKVLVNLSKDG